MTRPDATRRRRLLLLRSGIVDRLSEDSLRAPSDNGPGSEADATGHGSEPEWTGERRTIRADEEQLRFAEALGGILPLDLAARAVVDAPQSAPLNAATFELPYLLVGRHPHADLQFPDAEVSTRHVYLQLLQGRVIFCDLASRTGVWQNGLRRSRGWFSAGDALTVGSRQVQRMGEDFPAVRHDHKPSPWDSDSAPREGHETTYALEFHRQGSQQPTLWQVNREVSLIGSSEICKVRLRDRSVERVHASLVRTAAGLWLIDLLSDGGTWVDGDPIRLRQLQDGDTIEFGERQRVRVRVTPPKSVQSTIVLPVHAEVSANPQLSPSPRPDPHTISCTLIDAVAMAACEKPGGIRQEPTVNPDPIQKQIESLNSHPDRPKARGSNSVETGLIAPTHDLTASKLVETMVEHQQTMQRAFEMLVTSFQKAQQQNRRQMDALRTEIVELRQELSRRDGNPRGDTRQ